MHIATHMPPNIRSELVRAAELSDPVARVVEILEAVATGTVTVRIVPPGRPCLVTVVVDDGETSSRIELPEAVDA